MTSLHGSGTSRGGARLSVITAVLDRADSLERCLASVARQRDAEVEHIVVDGGSTDGSIAILERWTSRLAYWQSEPDGGIASAMNKGLLRATGEWVLFLHADDALLDDDSVSRALDAVQDQPAVGIAGFPIRYGTRASARTVRPRGATPWIRFKTGFLHQGTLIRRGVFQRIGDHDTSLAVAMDYDFFLRAWLAGVPMATFRTPVLTLMADTGVSGRRDPASLARRFREERRIHEAHASGPWRAAYALYWLVYPTYRRLFSRGVRR